MSHSDESYADKRGTGSHPRPNTRAYTLLWHGMALKCDLLLFSSHSNHQAALGEALSTMMKDGTYEYEYSTTQPMHTTTLDAAFYIFGTPGVAQLCHSNCSVRNYADTSSAQLC